MKGETMEETEEMKTFIAKVEERYVWDCPYCGEACYSEVDDPEVEGTMFCEICGIEAKCEYTDRV